MTDKSSDNFAIDQFRRGEKHAFNDAFNRYYDSMYLFANNLIRAEQEAKDIATESFIKLWKLHPNFESLANIKAFLFVTTRNACLDYLRSLQKQRIAQKEIYYLLDKEHRIDNEQIDAEVFAHLMRKIEDLPHRCKEVFKLFYFHHLRTSDIATQLNMNPQTVLNQKTRAIHILRSALFKKTVMQAVSLLIIFPLLFH